jgi:hypothetical protein
MHLSARPHTSHNGDTDRLSTQLSLEKMMNKKKEKKLAATTQEMSKTRYPVFIDLGNETMYSSTHTHTQILCTYMSSSINLTN